MSNNLTPISFFLFFVFFLYRWLISYYSFVRLSSFWFLLHPFLVKGEGEIEVWDCVEEQMRDWLCWRLKKVKTDRVRFLLFIILWSLILLLCNWGFNLFFRSDFVHYSRSVVRSIFVKLYLALLFNRLTNFL